MATDQQMEALIEAFRMDFPDLTRAHAVMAVDLNSQVTEEISDPVQVQDEFYKRLNQAALRGETWAQCVALAVSRPIHQTQ
ncbi:hypothetical protein ABT282_08250 [Streptomyces sp. NPDC000927]|uniref:hypothetical protein n=1 Tax=Streptomyces sp. NPDC000927 TaxID=3154371 RepID=UPI003323415E